MSAEPELELTANWHVSKVQGSGEDQVPTPCKAFYCLKWGDEIIERKEYTQAELEQEIHRLHQAGVDATDHERALRQINMQQ